MSTYAVFFSQWLKITSITIVGNEKITTENLTDFLSPQINRFFLLNKNIVVKIILSQFPRIERASIAKNFPDSVTITITERKSVAVFCDSNQQCFLIDKTGVIFEPIEKIPENTTVITQDVRGNTFLGVTTISQSMMDAVMKIKDNLKNNFNIDTKEVIASNPLIIKTSEQWQIYFNADVDINLQVKKMNSLLEHEISEHERKNLHYMYLQYKDKAYYQ